MTAQTQTLSLARLTSDDVWRELSKRSFAVLAYANARGEPRSSGVVYGTARRRLFVAVAPDSWKARQIHDGQQLAVTVPVRRGGILALLFPIPPAAISFHARAVVHPSGSLDPSSISKSFARLLPGPRQKTAVILELVPEGEFLTYGIGVSLSDMREPERSQTRVPVG